jgi:hypothetical protein
MAVFLRLGVSWVALQLNNGLVTYGLGNLMNYHSKWNLTDFFGGCMNNWHAMKTPIKKHGKKRPKPE